MKTIALAQTSRSLMALSLKYIAWNGMGTAVVYALLVVFNIGAEFVGFSLFLISAVAIGFWTYFGRHQGIYSCIFFPRLPVPSACCTGSRFLA
jgi:hypothetical protein